MTLLRSLASPTGKLAALVAVLCVLGATLAAASGPALADEEAVAVPARPSALEIDVSAGPAAVSLDWGDVDGADDYLVRWRAHGPGNALNDGERVAESEATIDVGAAGGWVVLVQACNTAGCGPRVNRHITVAVVAPSQRPTGLSVDSSAGPGAVALDWDDTAGATEYWVRWRQSGAGNPLNTGVRVAASEATIDVGTAGGWVVLVQACNTAGCGPRLNRHFAVAAIAPTDSPTGLSIDSTAGPGAVSLDWDDVTGATEYLVRWRAHGAGNPLNTGVRVAVSEAVIDVGSAGGWVVLIRACNSGGCGPRVNKHFVVDDAAEAVSDPPEQRSNLQVDDEETVPDPPGLPASPDAATTTGSLDVTVTWGAADNAVTYRLKWRPLADTEFDAANNIETASTSGSVTVDAFGMWVFQLEACNTGGCGPAYSFTADVEDHPEEPVAMEANTLSPLVSNTGKALGSSAPLAGTGGASQAQAFTTGPNASGYALESVEVKTLSYTSTGTTVQIATGLPSATNVEATLNTPSGTSTATRNVKFTAPPGITLSPTTTYWVVVAGPAATTLALTSLDSDDSGAAAGFSIADSRYTGGAGSWTQDTIYKDQIRVNGIANTGTKFVSNTAQTAGTGSKPNFSNDNAQGFATGSNAGGYTLTQMDFQTSGSGSATFTVDIYEVAGALPGSKVGTLTAVSGIEGRFTGSVELAADTDYFAVLDVSSQSSGANKVLEYTTSGNEDAGALAGWAIHTDHYARPHGDTSWAFTDRERNQPLKIALYGYSHTAPKFVSNTGEAAATGSKPNFSNDNAQGFATGSNSDGYTLTQVDFQTSGSGSATFTVGIYKTAGALPGSTPVGTLTPVSGVEGRFAGSVELDADTDYFAVLDVSTHSSGANKVLEYTTSGNEDAGALAGWAIHTDHYARPHGDTSWAFTDRERNQPLKISLRGNVKDTTAPSVVSANLVRATKTMSITFDEALDDTSVPAAGQFDLGAMSGGAFTPANPANPATSRAVSGKVVSLVFNMVDMNATHVRYQVPTGSGATPLRDAKGNDVVAFTTAFTGGGGTDYDADGDGLIEIDSAAQLNAIRWDLNGDGSVDDADANQAAYLAAFADAAAGMGCPAKGCNGYELTADVDLGVAPYNTGAGWSPIGTYKAVLEGNGHTVESLTIDSEDDSLGLFSVLGPSAKVRNLGVVDARIAVPSGNGVVSDIGVLAGTNNGLVEAVHTTGTVTCERLQPSSTSKCAGVGGLVGANLGTSSGNPPRDHPARIRRSSSFVKISGPINDVGGLVGSMGAGGSKKGIIEASFAAGDVSGRESVGGLVGFNYTGQIVASYAVGSVISTGSRGGLIGDLGGRDEVTASYYDSEASGQADTVKGKGVAKTTEELAAPTCYCGIYARWNRDLDDRPVPYPPWRFGTSQQYPGLVDVNGVVHRPVFPAVASATARGSTVALTYSEALDEDSVPAAADFSVNVSRQGADDRRIAARSVRVSGRTVTLSLASSVGSADAVAVDYAIGASPIRSVGGTAASGLTGWAVSLAAPQVRAAIVSRTASPWQMTVELDQTGLQGSFIASAWSVRPDGGAAVRATGGSVDLDAGTVSLILPATLSWDDTLTVSYRQSGSASTRLRNSASNPIASFTYTGTTWTQPQNAACTLGPGPDPRNPESPCGTSPEDISTAVDAYKSIHLMTHAELTDPPEPDSVAIECSSPNNRDCVITWERPCTDAADFAAWSKCRHWPTGYSASFVFKAYLIADLNRTSVCTTRSVVVDTFPGLKPDETETRSDFDLDNPPSNLPAGCTLKQWVASVVIEQGTSGGKSSGAAWVRRDP